MANTYNCKDEAETLKLAECFATKLKPGDVVTYTGGMGAGKTKFSEGIAKAIGVKEDISSPTFALVNEYHSGRFPLYHFDMYRVEGYDDLCSTGFFDYLETEAVLLIEWSENIKEHLPEGVIEVDIAYSDSGGRIISIDGGARFENISG